MPMKLRRSLTCFGGVIVSISCTFLGCGLMPVSFLSTKFQFGGSDFQPYFLQPGKDQSQVNEVVVQACLGDA